MGNSARTPKKPIGSDQDRRPRTAKAWIKANSAPVDAFPNLGLFASGAWNILLTLYVSLQEHVMVDTGGACTVSGAAPTTALRYIAAMINAGLIIRFEDPLDGRRSLLQLSQMGAEGVERAIDAVSQTGQMLDPGRLFHVEDV